MPVYEYECTRCGHCLEVAHGAAQDPKTIADKLQCPCCKNKTELKRIISKSSFSLKGRGWAKEGYK